MALDLAPDSKVRHLILPSSSCCQLSCRRSHFEIQVRRFIVQAAEREGIELFDAYLRLLGAIPEEETA